MSEIRIHQDILSLGVTSVKSSKKNFSTDFKSLLNEKIFEVPSDFENYRCGINFGDEMNFSFPPDDAPNYFKNAWYDVTSKMNFEERSSIFNLDVTTAIRYGYYFSMDYEFNSVDFEKDFNAMNSRVKNLGAVGCLELAIRSTEQCYNDNIRGGNEKKFIELIKNSLDAMEEIMDKCKESGDKNISRQIKMADVDFFQCKQKILHDAEIWLQHNGGDDIATMSDEKFDALMNKIQPTFTKYLPDGTIITINSETNKILDISKENIFNQNLLQII